MASSSWARAGPARPRWRASWPRPSTAPTCATASPATPAPSCVSIREGRALDVIELDAASNNRVDDMRELVPRVYTAAADLRRKVFIIDEVQRIKEGWDVLLKTLEEPPPTASSSSSARRTPARSARPSSPGCSASPSGPWPCRRSRASWGASWRPRGAPWSRRPSRSSPAWPAAACATPSRCSTRCSSGSADPISAGSWPTCSAWPTSRCVDDFIDALVAGDVLARHPLLDALEAEGRDLVAFSEQLVTRLRERARGAPVRVVSGARTACAHSRRPRGA